MDIYCPKCGEPYDLDFIQHDMTVLERRAFWSRKGCSESCKKTDIAEKDRPECAAATAVLLDVLGSDVDGIAAMLEDFGF